MPRRCPHCETGHLTLLRRLSRDDSNRAAMTHVARTGATYIHPFADPAIMAGKGTVALELFDQDPETGMLIIAIGGGGLISGVAVAAKALFPRIRIIGVEPVGAPTLHASLAAGRVVELEEITTAVPTMAACKTEQINFDIVRRHVEEIVLVTDEEMREAARWLWFSSEAGRKTCALVCVAGNDSIQ